MGQQFINNLPKPVGRDLVVEPWPLERLVPLARNARTHSTQVAEIAGSIRAFGFTNPILVGEAGDIIAGHGRLTEVPNTPVGRLGAAMDESGAGRRPPCHHIKFDRFNLSSSIHLAAEETMSIPARILGRFPAMTDAEREQLLAPPTGRVRMILDTDTANEIDDQFALAWTLLSPDKIELEGVTAEPFSFQHLRPGMLRTRDILAAGGSRNAEERLLVEEFGSWIAGHRALGRDPETIEFVPPELGADLSYEEIRTVFGKVGKPAINLVFRGARQYLTDLQAPIRTPAAEHIIERAMAKSDRPLYVAAIGCLTNLASAMLIEPAIVKNIVVLWTSAYPSYAPFSNEPSLNLVQDVLASQLLFACGVPHIYLPGYHVGAQLRLSLPEMEQFVRGRGAIGDYLYHLFTHNPLHDQRGMLDTERRTWVIWDIINIAWLLTPSWVPTMLAKSPLLGDDFFWHHPQSAHVMREAIGVDRDAIFIDFYDKLAAASR
jgi:inosine-uridine nucleoside N-ribohydrolase